MSSSLLSARLIASLDSLTDPALTDISNRIRLEAMEELTRIEIKFAKVRERLFAERTGANEREHNAIMNGAFSLSLAFVSDVSQVRRSHRHAPGYATSHSAL